MSIFLILWRKLSNNYSTLADIRTQQNPVLIAINTSYGGERDETAYSKEHGQYIDMCSAIAGTTANTLNRSFIFDWLTLFLYSVSANHGDYIAL